MVVCELRHPGIPQDVEMDTSVICQAGKGIAEDDAYRPQQPRALGVHSQHALLATRYTVHLVVTRKLNRSITVMTTFVLVLDDR